MSTQQRTRITGIAPLFNAGGVLQRQCACGQHTVAGGECSECHKKKSLVQRKEFGSGTPNAVVQPPHHSDPSRSAFTEPHFAYDFSQVRVSAKGHPSSVMQVKLAVNEPGDIYEQEADRVSEEITRKPLPNSQNESIGAVRSRVQRRGISSSAGSAEAPPIVSAVLQSTGEPLDVATRAFMEPRFGHDFSRVRVHTDSLAAESARAVNAVAYTVGRDVVFGAGQFAPGTQEGNRLMAHELTHVVQQGSASSNSPTGNMNGSVEAPEQSRDVKSDAMVREPSHPRQVQTASGPWLMRKVGKVNCPPNVFGAPADPKAALEPVDPLAVSLATQAADALATDAKDTKSGIPASPSVTFQSYSDHFGLPNPVGKGFMNRLTGAVRPSQEIAASEELNILSKRFRFSARLFSQTVNYRCPGTATVALPGCGATSCGPSFAFSCRGGSTIGLCQPFWDELTSDETKAAALIHESMHMIFGETGLSTQGEIGETTQRGAGRNFNIAGCYEFIINDMAGIDSFPVCPPVP